MIDWLRRVWLPLLVGIVCFLPFYSTDTFVGDLGDTRFNMYVMEHGYRTLLAPSARFWDAPFFYPQKNVIAYSDHHLGNLPLYAAFRAVGLERETAFQYWTLATLALTYLSAYLALRTLGGGPLAASLAAAVFAFGLPVHAQAGHVQLLPRFLVPWVFVYAERLASSGKLRDFAWLAALMVGQMYLGIYCAVLTAIPLLGYLLWTTAFGERGRLVRHFMGGTGREMAARAAVLALAAGALLPITLPYLRVAREFGMRPWGEIVGFLPRWNSWFYPPWLKNVWVWMNPADLLGFRQLPLSYEHHLFVGLATLLALLVLPFLRFPKSRLTPVAWRAWAAVFFSIAVTLLVGEWTLWKFFAAIPGVGAVRAITRVVLFVMFPMAVVLTATLQGLADWARARAGASRWRGALASAAGGVLAVAVLLDGGISEVGKTPFSTSQEGVNRIKRALAGIQPGEDVVFWVCDREASEEICKVNVDAMLAAQDLGIATLNGYSGWAPLQYRLEPAPQDASTPRSFYPLKKWLGAQGVNPGSRLVVLDRNGRVAWDEPEQCKLGVPMVFSAGKGERYLGAGFHEAEPGGIWTNAPWAQVSFKVEELPRRDLSLTLEFETVPQKQGQQTLCLKINGSEIGTQRIDSAGPGVWTIRVPEEIACRDGGVFKMEIGSDLTGISPKKKRKLTVSRGVYIKALRLE